MNQQLIIIVLSAAVLLIMAATLLFIYFRSLRHELLLNWQLVLDNLRLRLDKIPTLLETVRAFAPGEEKLITELIKLRGADWPAEDADKTKISNELAVSMKLKEVLALSKKYPELGRDTNFMAMKTEFKEINAEIEKNVEFHNKRIARYNGIIRFFLFLPLSLLMGFPKMPAFVFES